MASARVGLFCRIGRWEWEALLPGGVREMECGDGYLQRERGKDGFAYEKMGPGGGCRFGRGVFVVRGGRGVAVGSSVWGGRSGSGILRAVGVVASRPGHAAIHDRIRACESHGPDRAHTHRGL